MIANIMICSAKEKFTESNLIFTDSDLYVSQKNDDKNFIIKFLADEELSRYLALERPYNEDEDLKWSERRLTPWRQHQFGTFTIILEQSNNVIGYCDIESRLVSLGPHNTRREYKNEKNGKLCKMSLSGKV